MSSKLRLTLLCLFALNISSIHFLKAQEGITTPIDLNSNIISGNVGFFGVATLTLHYERILKQHISKLNIAPFVRLGSGGFASWDEDGIQLIGQIGVLSGEKKNHIELAIGGQAFIDLAALPVANAGWRYQAPGKPFVFGMGLLTYFEIYQFVEIYPGAYVGMGLSF